MIFISKAIFRSDQLWNFYNRNDKGVKSIKMKKNTIALIFVIIILCLLSLTYINKQKQESPTIKYKKNGKLVRVKKKIIEIKLDNNSHNFTYIVSSKPNLKFNINYKIKDNVNFLYFQSHESSGDIFSVPPTLTGSPYRFYVKDNHLCVNTIGYSWGQGQGYSILHALAYRKKTNELVFVCYINFPNDPITEREKYEFSAIADTMPKEKIKGVLIKLLYKLPHNVDVSTLEMYKRGYNIIYSHILNRLKRKE